MKQGKKNKHPFKGTSEATLEDLKYRNIGGQLNDSYEFYVLVPKDMLVANVLNRALVLTNIRDKTLSSVVKGTTYTSIADISEENALLKLTVAEPYLKLVLRDLRRLEGAEIQLRSKLL